MFSLYNVDVSDPFTIRAVESKRLRPVSDTFTIRIVHCGSTDYFREVRRIVSFTVSLRGWQQAEGLAALDSNTSRQYIYSKVSHRRESFVVRPAKILNIREVCRIVSYLNRLFVHTRRMTATVAMAVLIHHVFRAV